MKLHNNKWAYLINMAITLRRPVTFFYNESRKKISWSNKIKQFGAYIYIWPLFNFCATQLRFCAIEFFLWCGEDTLSSGYVIYIAFVRPFNILVGNKYSWSVF